MSNDKQSSVEMIEEFLLSHCNPTICNVEWSDFKLMLEQAKAMHKSEIIWAHGIKIKGVNNHKCVSGEQYYNETFGDESNT